MTTVKHKCIIAVHAGAGYHSSNREQDYRIACAKACEKAMTKLKNGLSASEAVTLAIQCLEDSSCTNAGVGSSLTMDGTVECDASIMDGPTLMFGAVGAVSDIKNPIMVAQKLMEMQQKGTMSLGRIPPCIMVGKGASSWAKKNGITAVLPDAMKSASSVKVFENHKRRLESSEERKMNKRRKHLSTNEKNGLGDTVLADDASEVQDTVGAICLDMWGNTAAGVSSGGISLKQPGRLGPAAMLGAGCWACNWKSDMKPGVAVVTSGTGEHLMKTLLARECAACIQREELPMQGFTLAMKDKFLESEILQFTVDKFGGVLALKQEKSENGNHCCELLWGHTTDSMSVGYMTSDCKPKTLISRLEEGKQPGRSFLIEGRVFTL